MDASQKGTGGRQQQENPIVLVVDGDTERRFCTTVYLQRLQYHAFSVEKGGDAMQVMKLTRPLILITELVLPDMNGIDLLARMKQAPWTQLVPAIVYTAITDPAYQAPCEHAGCAGYVTHSADYNKLYEVVQRVTEPTPRHYVRLSTWFDVLVTTPGGGSRRGIVTAISQEGMFVDMSDPLAYGTKAAFTLYLPKLAEDGIMVSGEVLYSHQGGKGKSPGMGVRFLKLWSDEGALIKKFIRNKLTEAINTTIETGEFDGGACD